MNVTYLMIAGLVAFVSAFGVWFIYGMSNANEVFASPGPSCPNCATFVEGSGFGTISIPEDAEIAPAPCPNCFATISFEALTNSKGKVQNGTISIQYTDNEGVTQTRSGEFLDGSVGKDSFKLLGTIIQAPTGCASCSDVDFTLKGAIEKGSVDSANLGLKAVDGTEATFDNAKVTIATIPSET